MKKNNHFTVHQKNNHSSHMVTNPRGEMSQKRADLREKAAWQKENVAGDLKKMKKDTHKILLVAGAAFVTFQVVKALTKEKKKPAPTPEPAPPLNPSPEQPAPIQEPQGWGAMIVGWAKGQIFAYAAEKAKELVWKYVQSRINKKQDAEERTSDSNQEEAGRD